jgi:hypothetical protein
MVLRQKGEPFVLGRRPDPKAGPAAAGVICDAIVAFCEVVRRAAIVMG